ncbi:adenosylhomocysteinase [Halarsenatibacter silvermanii]|uniref:Adenosylhomocysteinase n=1 Tax=Halarsenatibacter silvermanii TaxID=321763 RepID=A0A1G9MW84_9FIRM|nr:adenosylhomocysteinase [Halarsenatibacter silvermanii]SDL78383.1 adenosylhomocysteinase [Halarsenatibacter silvermanii]
MSDKESKLGSSRIDFDRREMPVLTGLKQEWSQKKPLEGSKISCCLHITTETAVLMETLAAGGAEVRLCASNPLSTQDDVAAYLNEKGLTTYGQRGESQESFYRNIEKTLEHGPDVLIDDGGDMTTTFMEDQGPDYEGFCGVCEETTTGINRLKAMSQAGELPFPAVDVNGSQIKHLFDNYYGTGQSSITGILRATNRMLAGRDVVVVGYGFCGEGVARDADGLGARVHVVESDPVRALRAGMDGFNAVTMDEAAEIGDIFVTATGNKHVIDGEHIAAMSDGAILANAGHFNVEINLDWVRENAVNQSRVNEHTVEFELDTGKSVHVIAEGRLVNLCAGEGHPASVMDMSFAGQALSAEWLLSQAGELDAEVHSVPEEIDKRIATLKLKSLGMAHQPLTEEQIEYMNSWQEGT